MDHDPRGKNRLDIFRPARGQRPGGRVAGIHRRDLKKSGGVYPPKRAQAHVRIVLLREVQRRLRDIIPDGKQSPDGQGSLRRCGGR